MEQIATVTDILALCCNKGKNELLNAYTSDSQPVVKLFLMVRETFKILFKSCSTSSKILVWKLILEKEAKTLNSVSPT